MLTFVLGLAVLAGFVFFLYYLIAGTAEIWAVVRGSPSGQRGGFMVGLLHLGAAVALVCTPFASAAWAEASTGWVDADQNGMLDPFANGGYDYFDLNGDHLLRSWGLLTLVIVVATSALTMALRRNEPVRRSTERTPLGSVVDRSRQRPPPASATDSTD